MFGITFVSQLQADTMELESRYVLGRLPNWGAKISGYRNGERSGYLFKSPSGAEYALYQSSLQGVHRENALARNAIEQNIGGCIIRAEVDARQSAYIVAWRQIAEKAIFSEAWHYDEKSNGMNSHYLQVYVTTKMGIFHISLSFKTIVDIRYSHAFPNSDFDIIQLARAIADGAQEQLADSQSSARTESSRNAPKAVGKSSGPADLKTFYVGTWTWKAPNNSNIWHSMSLSSDGSAMYYWRNPNQEPILQMWPFEWKATSANSISLGGRIYTLRDGKLYESGNVKDGFVKATKAR